MASPLFRDVDAMLAAHGITAAPEPHATNGFSGARMFVLNHGDDRFVLKLLRFDDDWLMRGTHDASYREAQFAVSPLIERLPAGVIVSTLAVAADGDGRALLMRDVSATVFVPERESPTEDALDAMLRRVAELHAAFWEQPLDDVHIGWCAPDDRLTMLGPPVGQMLVEEGRDFGIARGWQLFDALAPEPVSRFVRAVFTDPQPFALALRELPATLVHGDLKVANAGIDVDGALVLLDWALVMHATVAFEIAWLLAVNASVLPWPLTDTLGRYESYLEGAMGSARFAAARWPAVRAAVPIIGTLMYGWGKALDADGGRADEFRWWCDAALAGIAQLGL